MHCYESEALRLWLYVETHLLQPDTVFDRLALDQALDEFQIQGLQEYQELDAEARVGLARRVHQLSPRKRSSAQLRAVISRPPPMF